MSLPKFFSSASSDTRARFEALQAEAQGAIADVEAKREAYRDALARQMDGDASEAAVQKARDNLKAAELKAEIAAEKCSVAQRKHQEAEKAAERAAKVETWAASCDLSAQRTDTVRTLARQIQAVAQTRANLNRLTQELGQIFPVRPESNHDPARLLGQALEDAVLLELKRQGVTARLTSPAGVELPSLVDRFEEIDRWILEQRDNALGED